VFESESEQKSENEIVLDANTCENLLKINEIENTDIENDDSQGNEIILEDSSEILSVPKIETIDTSDPSSKNLIEPAPMFTSKENISELAATGDVPKTESVLEKDMCQDTKNVLKSSLTFDEPQANTTDDSSIELIEQIDESRLPYEKANSEMVDEKSSEKISESPEPKPNNSPKTEDSVKCSSNKWHNHLKSVR
jgi:hypothetical protein